MERYPSNGKLLKIYGRFREHVCNDPWGASKLYGEATKQGTVDSLLSLAAASAEGDINVKLTSVLGSVDEKVSCLWLLYLAPCVRFICTLSTSILTPVSQQHAQELCLIGSCY